MPCCSGWLFRRTCGQCGGKRLEGGKLVKDFARLFIGAETQVDERFPVIFHKNAIQKIGPVQGAKFLHDPANMLLVLCRILSSYDVTVGCDNHQSLPPIMVDSFQGVVSSVVETTYFFMRFEPLTAHAVAQKRS